MGNKQWLAMVLAGGQGTRLGALTKELAKPAVPFGGQYRIIDFTLSNCRNSGIDTVGILTQYQPLLLNAYVGQGGAWDLDRRERGLHILPPYAREDGGHWYLGTADAVYQNSEFIEQYSPKYVVVLSGDHVYKMDYAAMLDYHKAHQADVTMGVMEVAWAEASRFGIVDTADNGRIIGFAEKPHHPVSNQASMGVYIFSWKLLENILRQDALTPKSAHDFGRDIIPALLAAGCRLFAYSFRGYWKDVGTIESYWEASMDLLGDTPKLSLTDGNWPIYSPKSSRPPQYHGASAKVTGSLITGDAVICGEVEHSVIFPGVHIAAGTRVKDCVIMQDARLENGVRLEGVIITPGTILGSEVGTGREPGIIPVAGYRETREPKPQVYRAG